MVLFFLVRGEEKCEIYYKKQKIYFCPFWELFRPFLVVRLPEKMIRKYFGGNEKEWRKKKHVILRKRCEARFLGIMGRKDAVCW